MSEWISLASLVIAIIGLLIKDATDKAHVMAEVAILKKNMDRLEEAEFITERRFTDDRASCRNEMMKDMNKLEARFIDVLRSVEKQNEHINCIDRNITKILTILEKEKN
jgi:hypothetical protein